MRDKHVPRLKGIVWAFAIQLVILLAGCDVQLGDRAQTHGNQAYQETQYPGFVQVMFIVMTDEDGDALVDQWLTESIMEIRKFRARNPKYEFEWIPTLRAETTHAAIVVCRMRRDQSGKMKESSFLAGIVLPVTKVLDSSIDASALIRDTPKDRKPIQLKKKNDGNLAYVWDVITRFQRVPQTQARGGPTTSPRP